MRFGQHLLKNVVPEWAGKYVQYEELKKIIKILKQQMLTGPPAEWDVGVSLSTPAPTNAAAMPANQQKPDASDDEGIDGTGARLETLPGEALTQNDFFKTLEDDMDTVKEFTRLQVRQIRAALASADRMVQAGQGAAQNILIGAKEQVDAVGSHFLKLEKYVNLNFTGFRKILKKHDKNLPNPCSAFYIGRLHQQEWVRGDFSDIIVNISRLYSLIRGDGDNTVSCLNYFRGVASMVGALDRLLILCRSVRHLLFVAYQ